jgi:glycosyltransferase involved in cell wall biosynthesis
MSNAAIYLHPNGFDTSSGRLLGRHSAGESFLRGYLRHADVDRYHFWNVAGRPQAELEALVARIQPPERPINWIAGANRPGLREAGVLNMPVPGVGGEAWSRRQYGSRSYAICGITHTTATANVMRILPDLLIAPTEPYDALICTSSAVRASVETQIEGVREYMAAEYGPRLRGEPQRVTIPLGINAEDFQTSPEQRKAWRERLDIPDEAVVALYVGRFNVGEKMNPALMALALERAAQQTGRPIYWVNSGWSETPESAKLYHEGVRALCPSVSYREVDGRPPDVRFSIWSVADFFISFSDNIQETFGLTPVEAMAAGLPCVVTDWNGYKDTVRHGEDGFRVTTYAPAPGAGRDLAYWYANDWINYTTYVGAAAQFTAIDLAQAADVIAALVTIPDLRRRLGQQAQAQARAVFDWSAIIPQYQALWAEQDAQRRAAAPKAPEPHDPFRPDPFRLFAGYPTHHLTRDWGVALAPGMTATAAKAILSGPLAAYGRFNRPTLEEVGQIVECLSEQPMARVEAIGGIVPAPRRPFVERGLLWLARYGVVTLHPPR